MLKRLRVRFQNSKAILWKAGHTWLDLQLQWAGDRFDCYQQLHFHRPAIQLRHGQKCNQPQNHNDHSTNCGKCGSCTCEQNVCKFTF